METYIIRVNGFEYEVEVEKKAAGAASQAPQASSAAAAPAAGSSAAPKAAPSPAPQAAPKAAAAGKPVATGTAGKVKIPVFIHGRYTHHSNIYFQKMPIIRDDITKDHRNIIT